jgi:hypothetical protein
MEHGLIRELPDLDDTTPKSGSEEEQYALAGQSVQRLDQQVAAYDIKGLSKNAPRFKPKDIAPYFDKIQKQYKLPAINPKLLKQWAKHDSYADYIADVLYSSRGAVSDNERDATLAIMAMRPGEFNDVQKALQKRSKGQGIGQFISGFFGKYTTNKFGKVTGWVGGNHWQTAKRLNMIVKHLKQINAPSNTIAILEKTLTAVREVAKQEKARWNSDEFVPIRWANDHKHEIALVLSIAALFVPGINAFAAAGLSSAIMLGDAAMYYNEGNRLAAGTMAIFALLPFLRIGKLIPGIGRLGAEGMAALGKKLATSNWKLLNRIELAVIKDMSKYQAVIKQDLDKYWERRFQNEMIDVLRATKNPWAKKIAYRIGRGTIKFSVGVGRFAKGLAPYDISNKAWQKLYQGSFLQRADQEDATQKEIDKILKQQRKKK